MKKFQKGFTLVEVLIVTVFLTVSVGLCGLAYILAHFLAKVW